MTIPTARIDKTSLSHIVDCKEWMNGFEVGVDNLFPLNVVDYSRSFGVIYTLEIDGENHAQMCPQ